MFGFGLFLLKAFSFLFAGLLAYFFVIVLGASLMKALHGVRVSGRVKAQIRAAKKDAAFIAARRNAVAVAGEAAKSNAELLELIRSGTDAQVKSAEKSLHIRSKASVRGDQAAKRLGLLLIASEQPAAIPVAPPLATTVESPVMAKVSAPPKAAENTGVSPKRPEAASSVADLADVDWFGA